MTEGLGSDQTIFTSKSDGWCNQGDYELVPSVRPQLGFECD
jgi:hypothetical protein